MKYWKLLFLCLAVNSCNLEKDPIQPVIDKTELQAINKALYQNFIVLASLREIAKILEYKISQEEGHETIIFCCDTFSQTIRDKEVEIRAELEKKLKDKPILSGRDEITKRGLVKLSEDEVFNKTIMQTLELDNKNE
ncbi:MAG: hypothetical protein LBD32_02635, partial [Cytophagales bacterium]|nr:hypothetical protein [Cytophagales bacterium]